ncbi:hypothetical protein M8494_22550 [Serratia ureilytica]
MRWHNFEEQKMPSADKPPAAGMKNVWLEGISRGVFVKRDKIFLDNHCSAAPGLAKSEISDMAIRNSEAPHCAACETSAMNWIWTVLLVYP